METSWIFKLKANGQIVANCHKQPAGIFIRERLSNKKINSELSETFSELKRINSKLNIILTVSPVRHLKDGAIANNLSKAELLLACEKLSSEFDYVSYFPSYEMVIDELRDYRFYKDDLVHISDLAVNYIYEEFKKNCFDSDCIRYNSEAFRIFKRLNHKPFSKEELDKNLLEIKRLFEKLIFDYPEANPVFLIKKIEDYGNLIVKDVH